MCVLDLVPYGCPPDYSTCPNAYAETGSQCPPDLTRLCGLHFEVCGLTVNEGTSPGEGSSGDEYPPRLCAPGLNEGCLPQDEGPPDCGIVAELCTPFSEHGTSDPAPPPPPLPNTSTPVYVFEGYDGLSLDLG